MFRSQQIHINIISVFVNFCDTLVEDDIRVINVSYCLVQALTLTLQSDEWMSKYSQVNWYVRNVPKSHDYSAITQVHTLLWFVLRHMFCWATVATSRSIDPRFCLQRFCRWVASPKQSTPPLSHSSFFLTSLSITFCLSVLSCLHFFPPSPPLPLSKQKRDQLSFPCKIAQKPV